MVTNKQPDDPSASPFLTRVRKQSFAISDLSSYCFGKKVPRCQMCFYDTYDLSKCDDGGASWGQKVRPGRRTQGGPNQSRNTQCSSSLQHFFALATVNLKKSRKLIGEKHIYFNMFVTKAFIHHPPLNCSCAYCSADTPHGGQHAERGSLKVTKMEFHKSSYLRFESL